MKFFLFVLLIILAITADSTPIDGFVGCNIGASKVSYDRTNNVYGHSIIYSQQHRYDMFGSFSTGQHYPLDNHYSLGYVFDAGIEKTKRIESTNLTSIEARRLYVSNLAITISYKTKSELTPYIIGGTSITRFELRKKSGADISRKKFNSVGWCLGFGLDYPSTEDTTYNIQYLHTYYGENRRAFNNYSNTQFYIYAPESYNLITLGIKVRF